MSALLHIHCSPQILLNAKIPQADIQALQGGSLDKSDFNVSELIGENKESFSVDEEKIKKLDERIEQLEVGHQLINP